ncbi:hypothetical protein [Streptomyces sp. NPDC052225]|uniref:hypothetical protein n=1 Tax=Streptomyces sp. NPDC052225 TaxID=3154949 RepID=UPI00344425D5
MTEQIGAQEIAGMTPGEIAAAAQAGQFSEYLAAPRQSVRPYTVPVDAEGRPVVQMTAAEVEALSPREKVAALHGGQLAAYMAGDAAQPAGGAEM